MRTSQKTVLVVDDEESLVELVQYNLETAGYRVLSAHNGEEALAVFYREQPDLIVLDRMLPSVDGLDICRQLRSEGHTVPILMLTARTQELDQVLGLELGADDYMTKPFSPRVLVAHVRALLRRTAAVREEASGEVYRTGDLVINVPRREVTRGGEVIELTTKEFDILVLLASQPGRVFTRDQIIASVWDYDFPGETRIVDVHVSKLRDKLEATPSDPQIVQTVRGVGYKVAG